MKLGIAPVTERLFLLLMMVMLQAISMQDKSYGIFYDCRTALTRKG